jgi:oxygen-independent coproporphyrinogen-3 oxidase
VRLSTDDELRADLIQHLMCHGEVLVAALEERHDIVFADYFADACARLAPLVEDGLVTVQPERIAATSRGRLLLRNIAMCFDRYLPAPGSASPFSRAI